MMLEQYGGKVPDNMEDLLKLPGVGRKTANLILGDVYHKPGVVVADTHCIRITGRLGLTDGTKDPVKVEQQLRQVLPPEESNDFCHRMVLHGRAVAWPASPTARTAPCGPGAPTLPVHRQIDRQKMPRSRKGTGHFLTFLFPADR